MVSSTRNNKRIAKNTMYLYMRMLFLMIVSLFTSRVVLDALGIEDYGIYNVVGGFVTMFGIISAALTSASTRFLTFEMGRGENGRQSLVFSSSVTIHCCLAVFIFFIAEVIGIWYINNIMVLPPSRLQAANWCFQFSLINYCTSLIIVPYNASIVAHEDMKTFAYVGLFHGIAQLGISCFIYFEPLDRLIFYAMMLMVLQFIIRYIYHRYCICHYQECRYRFTINVVIIKQIFGYSFWHLIGNGAAILKIHGVNLVLNFFFGPTVNAARGVANQVNAAISQFVDNFMMAMTPQITKSYAKGDYSYMHQLINTGARFSFYLFLILSLPIIINAETVLNLWLKEVPFYATIFTQLTLIAILISTLSRPLITAQNATGNVRNYQIVVGGIEMLNLPVSFCCLYYGMDPYSVVVVNVIVNVLSLFARIYMLPFTVPSFRPFGFIKEVLVVCTEVAILTSILSYMCYKLVPNNFFGFTINVILCIFLTSIAVYFVGCNRRERLFATAKTKQYLIRFFG